MMTVHQPRPLEEMVAFCELDLDNGRNSWADLSLFVKPAQHHTKMVSTRTIRSLTSRSTDWGSKVNCYTITADWIANTEIQAGCAALDPNAGKGQPKF